MYNSLKIVRKLSYAWMYYPNGLDTGFSISKGYITGDEVTGLVQIVEQGKTKRPEVYLENITVIDEYTGGNEVTFTTFYELEQYLVLLNNPLVVELVGGDFAGSAESNKFIVKPQFSIQDNVITIEPNGIWKINSVTYSNPIVVVKNIQLCQPGKSRLDYIVPNTSNGFDVVSGLESDTAPLAPSIAFDNLFVTFYLVSDESIQNPQEPINGEAYVQKVESQDFLVGYNGETVIDNISIIDNRSSIVLFDQVTEVQSLSILPQFIRPGKTVLIKNNTINNVLLKSNSGPGSIKFSRNITIGPEDTLHFKLNSQSLTLDLVGTNAFEKLDTGNYTGTAEDLNNRIDNILFPDAIITRGNIALSGDTITILTGQFTARINQIEVTNVDDFVEVINQASPGFNRIDIIVLDENGNFLRIEGEESLDIAVKPNPLVNTIEITSINVSEVGPLPIQPLPDYNALYFKRFKQTYKTSQPVFDINPDEDDYNIIFTNTAPTIVKIYPNGSFGKFIKNNSTHPLKSVGNGNVTIQAEPGVTLRAPNGLVLNKNQQCYLIKDDSNEWTFINPMGQEAITSLTQYIDTELDELRNQELALKADKSNTYTMEEVDAKVVGIYKFKGNKADYVDLIATTEMQVGDVYNLLSNEKNYGWTGTSWDDLGGVFDISGKEDVANKSTSVFADFLSNIKFPSVKAVYDWSTSLFQTWVFGINRILGVTYTVGINDYKTKNIFSNSSPIALSVPNNASVAIPIGTKFSYTVQGSGTVTISGAGITFIQKNLVYTTGDTFFLEKTDTDTWVVEGNIPAAGAIAPYTAFINTVSGNNSTAVLGDSSKPFLTDVAALAALPANDGNAWDFVYLCNNVTRTIIFPTQRKIRFICKNSGTFNLNNWFGFGVSIPEIYIDAPGCNITGSVTVQTSLLPTLPVYIDVNDFTFTNTNVGGGNTFISSNAKSFISINNIVCSIAGTGSLFNFGTFFINKATTNRLICSPTAEATIPELVLSGSGANFSNNSYPINKFKTKKITGTGSFEITGLFDVTDLETSANIDILSYTILTGVRSANYLGILRLGFQASNVMVMNFYGKLASWTIDTSAANNLTIHDSTIFLDQFLYRTTGFSGTRTWNFRNVEIIATNVSSTLSQNPNTNALTVINKTGFIKTNGTFDAQTTFVNRTPNSY